MVEAYKAKLIQSLLDSDALLIGDFRKLKSGRLSPWFLKADAINDGNSLLALGDAYAETIAGNICHNEYAGIVGIPEKAHVFGPLVVASLARRGINTRYSSYRQQPKEYDDATAAENETAFDKKQKQYVLGARINKGARLMLVDDVITAGDAKRGAISMIQSFEEDVNPAGIVVIANRQEVNEYGIDATQSFAQEYKTPVHYALTADDVYYYLKESGKLSPEDDARLLSYFRAWGVPALRAKYDLIDKPIIEGRSVIPACDTDNLELFERVVKETADVEKIGGYKIGFELGLRYGLPRLVEIAKKHAPKKPIIYDHQKAGTDIGDVEMGRKFAKTMSVAGVDAVILFPQAGPVTQTAFTGESLQAGLKVIVGGHMTHKGYIAADQGYLRDDAPKDIYTHAGRHGVTNFVVPGNKPELVQQYRELLEGMGVDPTFYAPGFIAQGGKISDAGKAAGERFHAIVGRDIMNAKDIHAKAEELTSQLAV